MGPNRTNFDTTFCGKLPLHQTNLIQPHGVLLLITKKEHIIIQVSENISKLVAALAPDIVDQPLQKFIDQKSYQIFGEKTAKPFIGKLPISLCFVSENLLLNCLAIAHDHGDDFLIEIELDEYVQPSQNSFASVFQEMKQLTGAINAATTIEEVCVITVKGVKAFSGFDKVMLYTFDKEWNGSVVAEAMEKGMDSYLGLKFPASDIPKPARDMYLKSPYRLIPNRDYVPVRLYPLLNPHTHTFTNLFETDLRSVAGVHLEYLKNMGVVASMSTRIIQNEKLWGLIACHHRTAKYLSIEERSVFEWLSDVVSAKISALGIKSSVSLKEQLNDRFASLVENIYKQDTLADVWEQNKDDIKNYLNADGLAFCQDDQIDAIGMVPQKHEIDVLQYWLQGKAGNKVYHEPALPHAFDEAEKFSEQACGLLTLPIRSEKGSFMLAFRQEVVKKVDWGGNPNEAVQFEPNSTAYHPRNSFSQWQEVVRKTAEPWLDEEIEAAESLRHVLIEFTLNKMYR